MANSIAAAFRSRILLGVVCLLVVSLLAMGPLTLWMHVSRMEERDHLFSAQLDLMQYKLAFLEACVGALAENITGEAFDEQYVAWRARANMAEKLVAWRSEVSKLRSELLQSEELLAKMVSDEKHWSTVTSNQRQPPHRPSTTSSSARSGDFTESLPGWSSFSLIALATAIVLVSVRAYWIYSATRAAITAKRKEH